MAVVHCAQLILSGCLFMSKSTDPFMWSSHRARTCPVMLASHRSQLGFPSRQALDQELGVQTQAGLGGVLEQEPPALEHCRPGDMGCGSVVQAAPRGGLTQQGYIPCGSSRGQPTFLSLPASHSLAAGPLLHPHSQHLSGPFSAVTFLWLTTARRVSPLLRTHEITWGSPG